MILRRNRDTVPKGKFGELVADTGTAATSYTDDTVAAETNYTYRIKAINEHGVSERSRWFHVDTPSAPVPAKPTGLSATASHDSVATTYTDDRVKAKTPYTYRIKAINESEVSDRSRWFHIETPSVPVPAKPRGLSATESHDSVTLTWDDPQDDSITGYVILRRDRSATEEGQFSELVPDTGSAATTYTDDRVKAKTP